MGGDAIVRAVPAVRNREVTARRVFGWLRARARDGATLARLRASGVAVPPRPLRERVHGRSDVTSFVATGRRCAADVIAALERGGVDDASRRVLDFGCGAGRVATWVGRLRPAWDLHGADIDPAAIEWLAASGAGIEAVAIDHRPPTPHADAAFDALYAVSVFTHLDRDDQLAWMEELRRLLRPGGVAMWTVHGPGAAPLDEERQRDLDEHGFAFVRAGLWDGVFPDWYQTSVQTEPCTLAMVERCGLELLAYLPRGLNDHQDVVLARVPEPA